MLGKLEVIPVLQRKKLWLREVMIYPKPYGGLMHLVETQGCPPQRPTVILPSLSHFPGKVYFTFLGGTWVTLAFVVNIPPAQ